MADSGNVGSFERLRARAREYRERAEWELAENALRDAETLCNTRGFPDAEHHKLDILVELAEVTRRHNKYDEAVNAHLQALGSPYIDRIKRIEVKGELGVNYRQLNRFVDAEQTLQEQYDLARDLAVDMEAEVCRAAGNLGMTKYQLYEQQTDKSDKSLLLSSIHLLEERVGKAQALQSQLDGVEAGSQLRRRLRMWESIGVSRLSLVYAANGDIDKALDCGRRTVEDTKDSDDPTIRAISRFFLGNALQGKGQMDEAREQYNFTRSKSHGETTPAIALCKESSDEHRRYLKQIIDVGVDLTAFDEQGYSALDYAVYSNDVESIRLLENGLARHLDFSDVIKMKLQAQLRKQFREVLHGKFRPILNNKRRGCVQELRQVYVKLIEAEPQKKASFDYLRLISYKDFIACGELPRFLKENGKTRTFTDIMDEGSISNPYIVFFSYRWIGRESEPPTNSPDNATNTQYHRMRQALEELLETNDDTDPENLYVWLDCACIDQDDIESGRRERGINALPVFLAQCNTMISLVDDKYLDRAWCAVEILIMQTLRENYGTRVFDWQEHTLHRPQQDRIYGRLIRGRQEITEPSKKGLSHESDRSHIRFLERQSMLLGKVATGS